MNCVVEVAEVRQGAEVQQGDEYSNEEDTGNANPDIHVSSYRCQF